MFIWILSFKGSLASMANASNFTTGTSLNNQSYIARPSLINLNPDEFNEGLHYFPFMFNLDRCNRSCNTLDNLADVNSNVFNLITRINGSKVLAKHVSRECKCKYDGGIYDLNQNWNNDKCQCESKNPRKHQLCEKNHIWNPTIPDKIFGT